MQSLRGPVSRVALSAAAALTLTIGVASAAGHRPVIQSNCNNSTECASFNQSGTGVGVNASATSATGVISTATTGNGVQGTSSSGIGLYGTTNSGTAVNGTSGSGVGIFGSSSSAQGVIGMSGGSAQGVYGMSATGAGVFGFSPGNYGVQGILQSPASMYLAGTYGEVDGTPVGAAGVYGFDNSGPEPNVTGTQNVGVWGVSPNNNGVFGSTVANVHEANGSPALNSAVVGVVGFAGAIGGGSSSNPGIGVFASNGAGVDNNGNGLAALEVQNIGNGNGGGGNNIIAFGPPPSNPMDPATPTMSLDSSGNMILAGTIYAAHVVDCTMNPPCPGVANDAKVGQAHAYAERQDVSTMETVGEGELIGGVGRVSLGSYAAKIDTTKNYLVFITPQGQTQGLYVAGKSPAGFAVRENGGGHSTVAFDYRIVGVPAHVPSATNGNRPIARGNGRFALPRFRAAAFGPHSHAHTHFRIPSRARVHA